MNSTQTRLTILIAAVLLVVSIPLFAHHGTGISYDSSKAWTKKAVVTEFKYTNPHPFIFLDVEEEPGKTVNWGAEIAPNIAELVKNGWTKARTMEALKPGTPLTVTIAPSRAGTKVGLLQKVLNTKGEEIIGREAR
jgi:hypothetical protein